MNSAVKEALQKITESIRRLEAEAVRIDTELKKTRAVKLAIMRAEDLAPKGLRAPNGQPGRAILEKLKSERRRMNNGQIRAALKKDGYVFSLKPLHVTKALIGLLAERPAQIRRYGEGKNSSYEFVGRR